jgi:hypothetical protein
VVLSRRPKCRIAPRVIWATNHLSRRAFLGGLAGVAVTARRATAAPEPRLVEKRVEKLYKIEGCRQPNDLQFVPDGLWVLDQVDPNKAFRVRPQDGFILQTLQTDSIHGSGITYGNSALWIASTKMKDPAAAPRTLKVDPNTRFGTATRRAAGSAD